ncbi:MAG: GNAT family N-acetyltransferase [Anaerolineales bacterium]
MSEQLAQVNIRAAEEGDFAALLELDHGYSTEYVWQMELDSSNPRMGAHFHEARLPRPMSVAYPRDKQRLQAEWKLRSAILLAEQAGKPCGYASLAAGLAPGAVWLTDLVVAASLRRRGIGSRLVLAAQTWARQHGHDRLVLEMQPKNQPAIRLAQKLAFDFAGYNDRYYENQDIALFFAKRLA